MDSTLQPSSGNLYLYLSPSLVTSYVPAFQLNHLTPYSELYACSSYNAQLHSQSVRHFQYVGWLRVESEVANIDGFTVVGSVAVCQL